MHRLRHAIVLSICGSLFAAAIVGAERPPLDRLVDVGGYRLHITCIGDGSPTVVLDDGLGGSSESWARLMPEIRTVTRVCSYDRPIEGTSAPAPRQLRRFGSHTYIELRNGDEIVRDLHTLLARAAEPAPYVLVGHSLAGLYAILYASKYPTTVAGMVLIDASHPDQFARQAAIIGPEMAGRNHDGALQSQEGPDINGIMAEVRSSRWRTDIPLYVLARGKATPPPPGWSPEQWERYAQAQRQMQQDHVQRSSNGKLIFAENSGHLIHLDQPALVVDAIRDVVTLARARLAK